MATRLFGNLVLLLLLAAGGTLPAQADSQSVRVLARADLKGIFEEIVFENAIWPQQDLNIKGFSSQPATLTVPAGRLGHRLLNQAHSDHLGKKSLSVAILVDGKEFGKVKMSGDLQLYGEVVCTTRRISRHTVLGPDDLKVMRRNITMLDGNIVSSVEEAVGKRLTTSLRPGSVIHKHLIENPPMVKRGDMVTIVARSDRLQVTAPGEVRNAGAFGDLVRVKNLMSRREVYARVIDPGTVETEF